MEGIKPLQWVIDKIRTMHGSDVSIVGSSYCGTGKYATFSDVDFGQWTAKVSHVMNGTKHPKRAKIENGIRHRVSLGDVKKRLANAHKDHVRIVDESYVCVRDRAVFIDSEHGAFSATPNNVLRGNCHPNCHRVRIAKSSANCSIERHWKTGKELFCQAGYEVAFVRWCNHHQIDFDWQITHILDGKKTYRIDAHILSGEHEDTWVEIKGFAREPGISKFEKFRLSHPNAELWSGDKLRELGIMDFHPKRGSKVPTNLSQYLGAVIDVNP